MDRQKQALMRTSLSAYPVVKNGNSWAVVIPKPWLDVFGVEVDGRTWVKMDVDAGKIEIAAIDPADVARLLGGGDGEA